jgi:hypothetical protein
MREAANGRAAEGRTSTEAQTLRLHLEVGAETIEVSIGNDGIRFRHPGSADPEGLLGWEEAIALSVLPAQVRRLHPRTAA